MKHGTESMYVNRRCRCDQCRDAAIAARNRRRAGEPSRSGEVHVNYDEPLAKLLDELFPDGLTDECPARKAAAA